MPPLLENVGRDHFGEVAVGNVMPTRKGEGGREEEKSVC